MKSAIFVSVALVAFTAGCAGREPAPVQVVKADDQQLACYQIEAELEANNRQMVELSGEESGKVAQNIAAGVAGLLIWPLWFAMDFQDAAGKEGEALAARNRYLAEAYGRRCADAAPARASERPAVTTVTAQVTAPAAVQVTAPAEPAVPGPRPYEGTRLDSFTPEQIKLYCDRDWLTRPDTEGRTLYNPCRMPEAFS
jgi:hypothetical protein